MNELKNAVEERLNQAEERICKIKESSQYYLVKGEIHLNEKD